jgi:hypothetical protein
MGNAHPLVDHPPFSRSESIHGIRGLRDEDVRKRLGPTNCISWNVGYLASTPPLVEVIDAWRSIAGAAR